MYLEAPLVDPFFDLYCRFAFRLFLVLVLVQLHPLPSSTSVPGVIITSGPAPVFHKAVQGSLSPDLGWVGSEKRWLVARCCLALTGAVGDRYIHTSGGVCATCPTLVSEEPPVFLEPQAIFTLRNIERKVSDLYVTYFVTDLPTWGGVGTHTCSMVFFRYWIVLLAWLTRSPIACVVHIPVERKGHVIMGVIFGQASYLRRGTTFGAVGKRHYFPCLNCPQAGPKTALGGAYYTSGDIRRGVEPWPPQKRSNPGAFRFGSGTPSTSYGCETKT